MYSKEPYFDPINRKMGGSYRYDHEGKIANYMASDPNLLRRK
jgi:hypothetical protein